MPEEIIETLDSALARWDELMTAAQNEDFDRWIEMRAEQEAENAWLRHDENLGWEEAMLESYLESGLISRY
jgi:hypothetical protein